MNAHNSKWYLRVAPDEIYWEPCAHEGGLPRDLRAHQPGLAGVAEEARLRCSRRWRTRSPTLAGAPYKARKVTFHLPDFIDIVVNAGDDRKPLGATIGQSLPNWGPVANEGRGRTVAMSNLYTDPDSLAARAAQAESLLDEGRDGDVHGRPRRPGCSARSCTRRRTTSAPRTSTRSNGRPTRGVRRRLASDARGAQGADRRALLHRAGSRKKGIIADELAQQTYVDAIVWAFGHISRGMYDRARQPQGVQPARGDPARLPHRRGRVCWDANGARPRTATTRARSARSTTRWSAAARR